MSGDRDFSLTFRSNCLRLQARQCEHDATDPRLSANEVAAAVDQARQLHAAADEMLGAH